MDWKDQIFFRKDTPVLFRESPFILFRSFC